jgi:hypothetical protein
MGVAGPSDSERNPSHGTREVRLHGGAYSPTWRSGSRTGPLARAKGRSVHPGMERSAGCRAAVAGRRHPCPAKAGCRMRFAGDAAEAERPQGTACSLGRPQPNSNSKRNARTPRATSIQISGSVHASLRTRLQPNLGPLQARDRCYPVERPRRRTEAAEGEPVRSDRPINAASEDRLHRASFARQIAAGLVADPTIESVVVAIVGSLGCGKSSLLRLRGRLQPVAVLG